MIRVEDGRFRRGGEERRTREGSRCRSDADKILRRYDGRQENGGGGAAAAGGEVVILGGRGGKRQSPSPCSLERAINDDDQTCIDTVRAG